MPKIIDDSDIYGVVVDLFVQNGYAATKTAEIARRAKINETTLFRKFGTKASLVVRAINNQLSKDNALRRLSFSGDLRDDLTAILNALVQANIDHGDLVTGLLIDVPLHPELLGAMEYVTRDQRHIASILARYQASGELRQEPILTLVRDFLASFMVREIFSRIKKFPAPDETEILDHVEFFIKGKSPD